MVEINIGIVTIDEDDIKNVINKVTQIFDPNKPNERCIELREIAMQYLFAGAYEAAILYVDKALKSISLDKKENLHKELYFLKSIIYIISNQDEKAVSSLDLALDVDPSYITAWDFKGIALYNLGKYKEAARAFGTAFNIPPLPQTIDFARNKSISVYGYTLCQLGRYEEAIEYFDKALELNQNSAYALTGKGFALEKLKNYIESFKFYLEAIKQDEWADAYNGIGNIHLNWGSELEDRGKSKEALEAYNNALKAKDAAIKINRNLWYVWYDKSLVLKALHRDDEAEVAVTEAKKLGYKG
jgi:tetratricopeptide (TPR) repeat protein